jgi:hypothetical protein
MTKAASLYFRVGHTRFWPGWFQDLVTTNHVITHSAGHKQPIAAADVWIDHCYIRAHHGDYVVLTPQGRLTIASGKRQ